MTTCLIGVLSSGAGTGLAMWATGRGKERPLHSAPLCLCQALSVPEAVAPTRPALPGCHLLAPALLLRARFPPWAGAGLGRGEQGTGVRRALSDMPTPSSWAQLGARSIQESSFGFSCRWKKSALPLPLEEVGVCLTRVQAGAPLKGHLSWALLRG